MTVVVRKAQMADAGRIAAALARAFDDDPMVAWLLPAPRSPPPALGIFELELRPAPSTQG